MKHILILFSNIFLLILILLISFIINILIFTSNILQYRESFFFPQLMKKLLQTFLNCGGLKEKPLQNILKLS